MLRQFIARYVRGCSGKKRYVSREGAVFTAVQHSRTEHDAVTPYRCPCCSGWHVGHHRLGRAATLRRLRKELQRIGGNVPYTDPRRPLTYRAFLQLPRWWALKRRRELLRAQRRSACNVLASTKNLLM